MVLSAAATLRGYAVQGALIHTYVDSDCGASWGCWGGNFGGLIVCSGAGSSIEADCISRRGAGIIYARNGVCHQTANRILSPSNNIIPPVFAQIRGTYLLYGRFGYNLPGQAAADMWPKRKIACSSASPGGPVGSATVP